MSRHRARRAGLRPPPELGRRPIAVDRKESREIAVPGLDTFTVDQGRAVAAPDPHVELRFTDPLKPGQNLKGLVRVGDRDDLRFMVDGSRVEVYGTKGWRGEQTVRVQAGIRNVLGYRMKEARELTVQFELLKPAVRFAGKGVVLPTSAGFTVPGGCRWGSTSRRSSRRARRSRWRPRRRRR